MFSKFNAIGFSKVVLFVLCLVPMLNLAIGVVNDSLGANPIEYMIRALGEWGLRFLLLTLAISPLRQLLKKPVLLRFRRMLGLFSFFYISVHLMTYLLLDQSLDWYEIWLDIVERPFITVGMIAFLLLIPLAITSTNKMMKRLGPNWKRLHRLIYLIASFGVLHFFWLVKADLREPIIYSIILALLLLVRLKKFKFNFSRLNT